MKLLISELRHRRSGRKFVVDAWTIRDKFPGSMVKATPTIARADTPEQAMNYLRINLAAVGVELVDDREQAA